MPRSEVIALDAGLRVKALRERLKWSQAKLAVELDMSLSAVQQLEQGRTWKKHLDLATLATVLKTTPNYLLGFDQDAPTAATSGQTPDETMLDWGLSAVFGLLVAHEGWDEVRAAELTTLAEQAAREFSRVPGVDPIHAVRAIAVSEARRRLSKK